MKTNDNTKLTAFLEYVVEKSEPYLGFVRQAGSSAFAFCVANATKHLAVAAVLCAWYSTLKGPAKNLRGAAEGEEQEFSQKVAAFWKAIPKSCKQHQKEILEAGAAIVAYMISSKSETPLIKNTAAVVSIGLSLHQVAAFTGLSK